MKVRVIVNGYSEDEYLIEDGEHMEFDIPEKFIFDYYQMDDLDDSVDDLSQEEWKEVIQEYLDNQYRFQYEVLEFIEVL